RGIAVVQIAVPGLEPHAVIAHACGEQPGVAQAHLILDKHTLAVRRFTLALCKSASDAAGQVVVARALIALAFQIHPDGQSMGQARELTVKGALRAHPGEPAVVGCLPIGLQREAVAEFALSVITAQLVGIAARLSIPDDRKAVLTNGLVRVEPKALWPRLGPISPDLIQGQPTGVFGSVVDR